MVLSIEIGLIILFSILGGVLAVRFKQPSVLGLIIVGSIVGPYTLGFIQDVGLINTAIEIGAILLLFTVGIEFSLQHLFNFGLRAVAISIIKLGTVFLAGYFASITLGFDFLTSLYIGAILSITSTVIVIKILEQKGMAKREELPLLITILILEDIFGVFALTFFSSINATKEIAPLNLFTKLLISITIMAVSYLILKRILKPIINWLVKYSTEDTITFISLGLCAGMSYLAYLFGLSPSVGAFLAGNIVSSLPNSKSFEKAIHPFILTFTALFFFSIGTIVNFSIVVGSISIVLILLLVNLTFKYLTIGFGSYLFSSFNGRQAVFSGIAMLSVGEFSLLIAREAEAAGLGIQLVDITASIIILSTIAMSYLISYTDRIYDFTLKLLPSRVREDVQFSSKYVNSISWTMTKDKPSMKKITIEWNAILNNLFAIFSISAIIFFVWMYFKPFFLNFFNGQNVIALVLVFFFIAITFPALKIIRNTRELLHNIFKFFVRLYPKEIVDEGKIFRNILIILVIFVTLFVFPSIFFFFRYNPLFNLIIIILTVLLIVYVFRGLELIRQFTKRHETNISKISKKYKEILQRKIKIRNKKDE